LKRPEDSVVITDQDTKQKYKIRKENDQVHVHCIN
jgi:hypothetical protein